MTQRGDIINRIQQATSLTKQGALVAELDRFDRESAARHQAANDLDWAGTVVTETLAPATAHERSTHETDWLDEITASTDDWANKVSAEAALWFGRTSAEVKADPEEFGEQAKGMARRTASAYGDRMADAERAFLDYVSFLHTQAASGLPQVEQLVDAHENPGQNPLPTDVFDTFGPPVHPINSGVSGTETSERAPLLQEIESDGGGGSAPTHHDTTQTFTGESPQAPEQMQAFTPTVAIGHTANLTDYLANLQAQAAACGCPNGGEGEHLGDCDLKTGGGYGRDPYDEYEEGGYHEGSRQAEAASSLDQIQQVVDNQENPSPIPLNTEVAFPWEIEAQPEEEERSDVKTSGLTPAQARAAHVARLSAKPDADLTAIDRQEIRAFAASLFKTADEWTQGGEQFHGPGAANTPMSTPVGTGGTEQAGAAAGQADWNAGGNQPTYADDSNRVPPFVQGYSEGYGQAANANPAPGGATPGLLPPGAGGMGQGYLTHAGNLAVTAVNGTTGTNTNSNTALLVEAKIVACDNCGKQDSHFNMQQRGNGSSVQHLCTDCAPVSKDPSKVRWQGSLQTQAMAGVCGGKPHGNVMIERHGENSYAQCPDCGNKAAVKGGNFVPHQPSNGTSYSASLRVSAAFVAPIEAADPEFAKAYKYASKWTEGTRLVKKGSPSFEAGLYAGMSDNPEAQPAWVQIHAKAAKRYRDSSFTQRIRLHRTFTEQAERSLEGLQRQGAYLRPVESAQKTAGTATDLDTMGPGVSPSATGETPINGPGKPPPLQGGTDPARPGGPAPYNGAEPFGVPAVPTGTAVHGTPTAIDTTPGGPVDQAAYQRLSPQTHAFRKKVQANLLQTKQSR